MHNLIGITTFLDDVTFVSVGLYKSLITGKTFSNSKNFLTVYISLNSRSYYYGIYTVRMLNHFQQNMKYECISKLRRGNARYKFVWPKIILDYNPETKRSHHKSNRNTPCTNSKFDRMIYIYSERGPFAYDGIRQANFVQL